MDKDRLANLCMPYFLQKPIQCAVHDQLKQTESDRWISKRREEMEKVTEIRQESTPEKAQRRGRIREGCGISLR